MLKLGILDQSTITEGSGPKEALQATTRLAVEADKLGYSRFWVSEHHSSKALAHSSPEVLIAHLAANTSRIRLGSGGIMLPHYSAYKVAENFRLLEALYPGRIDLGVGRAPGGRPLSTRALQEGHYHSADPYPQQIIDLIAYLNDAVPADHRFAGLSVSPSVDTSPQLWLLGSSGGTARLAAQTGASYAFAQFFGTPGGAEATEFYHDNFEPSLMSQVPKSLAAITVVCADTEEEAEQLASSSDLFFLAMYKGMELPYLPSVQTAMDYPYTPYDREQIAATRAYRVVGTPEQVKARLLQLSEEYRTDELMIVSSIHDFDARLKSVRLVAEAFGLNAEPEVQTQSRS
ncbi:LLM class flavin-dependent oxidoreductase [Saccharibacillus alkalitolerans]|uniref:LLM class flavin-dependent oxidoreductase n=1 Tax=Saccharibacillus alkalitolerans TaxID=2705290 RepID=A0ABX0F136_9BACL|nr:LLM class flavin-dependent oxidoreductase [Saccharibacillus alkalitolerans]NGZ74128.1 LLM class flavin-dependent oxidoreductase [Saccharibacillus alkalitolerans]